MMGLEHLGEIAAFLTALCWVVTGLAFEYSGKKIGSNSVNLLRLIMAFLMMMPYLYWQRGLALPVDANASNWWWLSLSGLAGLFFGDLFLFESYIYVGARVGLLIMSLSPILTGLLSYFIFGETLRLISLVGIALTLLGITMVILMREGEQLQLRYSAKGLLFAGLGALGQSVGLIFSKLGMQSGNYDPVASTHIRILVSILAFALFFTWRGKWPELIRGLRDRRTLLIILIGAIFGPFVGVSLSLVAVKYTETAIASTIMSLMPIIIIPFSVLIFREKVGWKEILGALVSVVGVAILFIS